ncbi:MAG: hypothetical protein ABIP55_13840 [Tepidisphaeraceae bacterium]
MQIRLALIAATTLAVFASMLAAAKPPANEPAAKPKKTQQFAVTETDLNSPRKSKLKADTPDDEILRIDADNDGDPDLLETWWNGKRARWIDENDDMKPTDVRGDMTLDAVQIDRDDDGYYDGPEDLSIKWADDDGDGRPDLQLFAANPRLSQASARSGTAHWMVFIDTDHDGVNGYVDWRDFEFREANWRVPPTTSPTHLIPPPNFSPDYMGNAIFLKDHEAPGVITNPEMNWENPFAFYDFDDDGCTEMSIRLLETAKRTGGSDDNPRITFHGYANEAMGGWDLDNDSSKGNEFDFDLSWRFFSAPDAPKERQIDYRNYKDPHNMKAPQWVLDGAFFRFDNWRKIDHFIYVTHDKCFEEMWNTNFESCWLVFDEDDDDHRWERVEFQYPTPSKYSVKRWPGTRGDRAGAGLGGHPQADSLGDRGEWDADNSGRGQVYVGRWDGKLHLYGAETGAWTVDERGKYWGSKPVLGNSSPENAPKVEEIVQYTDTDKNGFFDLITFDYDGDEKVDLTINLLDYKTEQNPHPDVHDLINPGKLQWKGLHELFVKQSADSFQEALKLYRAAWKKGLTTPEIDDHAFASSTGDRYNQGYWLKEKIFRLIDQKLAQSVSGAGDKAKRDELRKRRALNDVSGMVQLIDSLDAGKGS